MAQTPVVQMRGIKKTFGSVVANSNVDLDVYSGEILSLLGENGSGKTTLMNMLSGIYFPDEGHILVNGQEVTIASPKDAFDLRIGMIHQHFKLVDVFTAAENIALGMKEGGMLLDRKKIAAKVREICDKYGFEVDPDQKVYNMSVSQKQTLEIVKVLYRGTDILILDEPTAVLTPQETDKLFAVLQNMKADGKSVIIITHKLHEVMEVSDRVAVLRKGESIGSVNTCDTDPQELTNMMVGRAVTLNIDRPEPKNSKPRLEVRHLTVRSSEGVEVVKDVSFTVNTGEVLGIAGISGCGQKELLEAIAGLQVVESGSSVIYLEDDGKQDELIGMTPRQIQDKGVALSFVPEDRLGMGLVGDMNIPANMMLRSYTSGKGFLANRKAPKELAEEVVEQLGVVTPDVFTPVRRLSGGNVQKILVGREIAAAPSVLMTAYVVRGLDINTSYAIYDLINQQKEKGCAVIFVGEDLDVLLELCDRIMVMCSGRMNGILDGRTATKEQVGLLMTNLQEGGAANG